MTDRLNGVLVAFERDIRTDDADALIAAIRQLRGVADVQPSVVTIEDALVTMRVNQRWEGALWTLIQSMRSGESSHQGTVLT